MNDEERNRILKMLGEGKLTVEEAEKLLDAIDTRTAEIPDARSGAALDVPAPETGGRPKKLRIVVDAGDSKDSAKVNVSVPLGLIRSVGPLLMQNIPPKAREKMQEKGVDADALVADIKRMIDEGGDLGDLREDFVNVDVEDETDRIKVRIYVE